MHGLKSAILANGWIVNALLVQPSISAHRKWPEMVVSASTNQVWTKITIRGYAWSFAIQIQIQAVWMWMVNEDIKENWKVLWNAHSLKLRDFNVQVWHCWRFVWQSVS
jgi:hypothetical protein